MTTVTVEKRTVHIPAWVVDLASFSRWANSEEFPEAGRISFINGGVWVDLSMEHFFSHGKVKTLFARIIGNLVADANLGDCICDSVRVKNDDAGVSNIPDVVVIFGASYANGRVRLFDADDGDTTTVEGSPDVVVEVVSDSSVDKDCDWLMTAYFDAGVREYWLVDARGGTLRFDVYRPGPKGFVAVRKSGGWVKSAVLGKSFRLTAKTNAMGHPDYALEVR